MPVREKLDPTPVAMPVGYRRPESLQDMVRRLVATHVSEAAAAAGHESFEEADDFDVGDDAAELRSPYEVDEGLPRWKEDEQRKSALDAFEQELKKREEALDAREEKEYRVRRRRAVKEKSDGADRERDSRGDSRTGR